MLIEGI